MRSIYKKNISKKHPIARPVRVVDPASDWYSTSVPVIIDTISYYIGLRYNGTQL